MSEKIGKNENRTENELLEMSEHFKQVLNRKDREIKVIKERCCDADDDLRLIKDRIIEIHVIIDHCKIFQNNNYLLEQLSNKINKINQSINACRDQLDSSDLDDDFFLAFEDQI